MPSKTSVRSWLEYNEDPGEAWSQMEERPPIIESFGKGDHTIYWGDAVRVLEERIPDATVQLVFADPPYNIGKRFAGFVDRWPTDADYAQWCYRWLELCIQKLAAKG